MFKKISAEPPTPRDDTTRGFVVGDAWMWKNANIQFQHGSFHPDLHFVARCVSAGRARWELKNLLWTAVLRGNSCLFEELHHQSIGPVPPSVTQQEHVFRQCLAARNQNFEWCLVPVIFSYLRSSSSNKYLPHALIYGNPDLVRMCLEQGDDPNTPSDAEIHPLCTAAWVNNTSKLRILLEAKANPNVYSAKLDEPPLLNCQYATTKYAERVQLLLTHKADPRKRNKKGVNALVAFAGWGKAPILPLLLSSSFRFRTEDLNQAMLKILSSRKQFQQHLVQCAQKDIETLLENKADPNARTARHCALELAFRRGYASAVRALLKAGARADPYQIQDPTTLTTILNNSRYRPMFREALTLTSSAVLNTRTVGRKFTYVILRAVSLRCLPEVKLLLQAQARVDVCDYLDRTVLHQAAKHDSPLLPFLLQRVQPDFWNRVCRAGQTALHVAAFHGCFECTRSLLLSGAQVNAQDQHGNTPALLAARVSSHKFWKTVQALQEHDAA